MAEVGFNDTTGLRAEKKTDPSAAEGLFWRKIIASNAAGNLQPDQRVLRSLFFILRGVFTDPVCAVGFFFFRCFVSSAS
jgi:hypothetical protein